MSQTRYIDSEEPFFQFDPYEGSSPTMPTYSPDFEHDSRNTTLSNHADISAYQEENLDDPVGATDKGKGVSKPVPIRPHTSDHDLFDMSPSGSSQESSSFYDSSSAHLPSTSSDLRSPHTPIDSLTHRSLVPFDDDHTASAGVPESPESSSPYNIGSFSGKGKERETDFGLPPTLPPLTFSADFEYGHVEWPLSGFLSPNTPGPSSYGSGYGSLTAVHSDISSTSPTPVGTPILVGTPPATDVTRGPPTLRRMPSRRRSFSNLSTHSTRSGSRMKAKFVPNGVPSTIARKLLFRKRDSEPIPDLPSLPRAHSSPISQIIESGGLDAGHGSCLLPWSKSQGDASAVLPLPLSLELDLTGVSQSLPLYYGPRVKGKGRSYSSPLPFSALDIVPVTSPDIFAPIPLVVRNYFDEVLPKELQLHVFRSLVLLHVTDHARAVSEGRWSVAKASSSKSRWTGRDKGFRELVKFSRVSKAWQMTVFDGQLWTDLDLRSFSVMPVSLVSRLSKTGGGFIRSLDIAGHVHILPLTLIDMTDSLSLKPEPASGLTISYTQLTDINLQSCSSLTTRSLHHLLFHSPFIQKLSLKGLSAVTNTTCDVLAAYCPQLTSLDMSRCFNMDADGIQSLAAAAITRGEHLLLKDLRLCGLKHVNDSMMATLGKVTPYLEVLDLSYARQLHNSALESFVSCGEHDYEGLGVQTIVLTGREAGREASDSNKYRRRVTNLRHISLSCCVLLTDVACSNLAYCVPQLEFLEMAGIGGELKDDGLVRLLNTTPFIRRLDLEDASDITDAVIAAITPSTSSLDGPNAQTSPDEEFPQAGHALEHLVVSFAGNLTDDALLALIRRATHLRVLEADNTRIGGKVVKEFVRLSKNRQTADAKVVAIDCRGVGENLVKELTVSTRPRLGWRAYDARKLKYVDGKDGVLEDLKIGQDECDEKRVVLKTFYSWQSVDAVRTAREKRRKSNSRRMANDSSGSFNSDDDSAGGRGITRWWSPGSGGRRSPGSGANSPANTDMNHDRDGCRLM